MSKNIKVAIVFVVILVGVFALIYSSLVGSRTAVAPSNNEILLKEPAQEEGSNDLNLPAPTGKTEDIATAVMNDAVSEEELAKQEIDDAQAAIDDSEGLDDFGQIYDTEEF